jgi:O-antigen/teichoic acid export membrane protein
MATASAVARGAVWNYSAQIVTVLVQFGYAAASSRLLPAHDFGVYAAGLASVNLINVVALAGLQQVVGRMKELDRDRLSGLLVYALVVGVVAAAVSYCSAPLWAAVWGVPDVVGTIHVLAFTSFAAPLVALGQGLSLRLGLFKRLAVRTVVANAAGMALGVLAVMAWRTTESLAVSQAIAQIAVAALLLWACRDHFRGRPSLRQTLSDVRFSGLVLVSTLLTYWSSNIGKLSVSNSLGTATLGNWNRADAITTNPFYTLGWAITQAVYPEFRHDIDNPDRARRVWSDLLGIVGWVCIPLATFVSVLAPVVVSLLLGDGWAVAAQYASVLAIIGGIQPVVFLLIYAFEALGRFSWSWAAYTVSLVINVASAIVAASVRDVWPIFIGSLVGFAVFHTMHLVLASRKNLIDVRRVLTHYAEIAAFSVALAAVLFTVVHLQLVLAISPLIVLAVAIGTVVGVVLLAKNLHRFPPIRLARAYGVLGSKASAEPVPVAAE